MEVRKRLFVSRGGTNSVPYLSISCPRFCDFVFLSCFFLLC
jgi:hypothetical protein